MPQFEKTTSLYEILIRFDPEGFRGAHAMDCETIREDGKVIAQTPGLPRPITLAEVGELIGKKNAELLERVEAEARRADEATRSAAAAEEERDAALAKLEAARAALAAVA